MRIRSLLILTAPVAVACAGPAPTGNLFGEYIRSTTVRNDRISSTGSSEDRIANFAAHYTPEHLQSTLLAAVPCVAGSGPGGAVLSPPRCELGAVRPAVQAFAGPDAEIFGRSVLVKHSDGTLELIMLHVARGADGWNPPDRRHRSGL